MYTMLRRPFVFMGNEIMRLRISIPKEALPHEIYEFYSLMSGNFIKWCETEEFPRLCAEYNDAHSQKYIYKKRVYSLIVGISYSSDSLLSVLTEARVTEERGDKKILFSEYQFWDRESFLLIPPRYSRRVIDRETRSAPVPRKGKNAGGDNGAQIQKFTKSP